MTEIWARASIKSIITTTDLGFDKWDQIFTDKVIAAAIVDRLTFKAFIIDMEALHTISRPLKKWMKESSYTASLSRNAT